LDLKPQSVPFGAFQLLHLAGEEVEEEDSREAVTKGTGGHFHSTTTTTTNYNYYWSYILQ